MGSNRLTKHPEAVAPVTPRATLRPTAPDTGDAPALDALTRTLGSSNEQEVLDLVGDISAEELIARGATVDTGRVTREVTHVVSEGVSFFASATAAQREALRISPDLLRVLAWSGAEGDRVWRALKGRQARNRTAKAVVTKRAALLYDRSRAQRDQLVDVLGNVRAGDSDALQHIKDAAQPAASGEVETGPGKALASLVAIGREALALGDAAVVKRCSVYGLSAAWLDECASLASKTLAAERAPVTKLRPTAAQQGLVDRWDGLNLVLIERVVRAFTKAHAIDATVPAIRLTALANLLGARRTRKNIPGGPPPTPPTG